MTSPSEKRVLQIIDSLDWQGHVELPELDKKWLAFQLSAALDPRRGMCESCGSPREILVPTRLGAICEECLEEYTDQAEAMRDGMRR